MLRYQAEWFTVVTMERQNREIGATPPMFSREHIVVSPGYCGGKAHVSGHRIKVQHIAIWHEWMGKAPDEIVAEHPGLTLADVYAALTYYYDHREQIDAEIRIDEEFAAGLEGAAHSPPSLLVQRLAYRHGQGDPLSPR
jgi:uncharacterized protein (DUF433 family)